MLPSAEELRDAKDVAQAFSMLSSNTTMIRILLLISCILLPHHYATAQQSKMPDFGEGNAVSLNQEYYLGRAWLMSFRRQAPILNDAHVQDYVERLVYRLVETSQLRERRLEIVLVRNKTINAFAVPGGIVGVHSGLILQAENEAQFASVLAHELAHLSQRHFSRGLEAQKRSSTASMAGLLAGLVMVAAGAGDAGMGTMMGSQAAAMDSQLRYSRLHEQEADRVGMQNQAAAGLDPGGAAGMFTVMQSASRNYGSRPPEFLMTHPLTEKRIADARNRANTYPKRMYEDNPEFQLMRARVDLNFFDDTKEAVAHFRQKQRKGGRNAVATQYGLIIALTKNGDFEEAEALLRPMLEFAPTNMTYALAQANIDIESKNFDAAIARLEKWLKLAPNNHPITMYLSKAYYFSGRYAEAAELLTKHSRVKPDDAYLWYLLAEDEGKAGNTLGVHLARAEYFKLNGALKQGIEQLNLALRQPQDNVSKQRIQTRIVHFQNIAAALNQL
jgi:beta-barrel assembly-enhancing protease